MWGAAVRHFMWNQWLKHCEFFKPPTAMSVIQKATVVHKTWKYHP